MLTAVLMTQNIFLESQQQQAVHHMEAIPYNRLVI